MRTQTKAILNYTFAFIYSYVPTAVYKVVFATKPGYRSYSSFNPSVSMCAVDIGSSVLQDALQLHVLCVIKMLYKSYKIIEIYLVCPTFVF